MAKLLGIFSLFFLVLSVFSVHSQEITVRDQVSQQSIPNARIISKNPIVRKVADVNGRFRLELFKECDTIYISYRGYKTGTFTYSELQKVVDVDLSDELSFSEMTVVASRWEEDKVKVPGRIMSLDLKAIAHNSPQTSADLLEHSGYVFVQKSQLAGGSPQLRGFGTNKVMIVVDGVRMNNAIFRAGNLQNVISLDPNSLESTEVLFGPGAVMYGSDAIGGVMSFNTKQAHFSPDSSETLLRTNVYGRYSSASNETTGHFDINIGKQKWAFLTAGTFSRYEDLRTGKFGDSSFLRPTYQMQIDGIDSTVINQDPRLQVASGYHQFNVIQKIRYKPSEKLSFDYGLNISQVSNAPRYDRLNLDQHGDGILDNAEWYYGPQKWMMNRLGMTFLDSTRLFNGLRMNLAYQDYSESRNDRKTNATNIRRQFENVKVFSLNVDFDKHFGKRTSLFYGLEGVINLVGSNAYREDLLTGEQTDINSRYPDGSLWQSFGVYTNAKHDLNEDWNINGGLRYSLYQIKASFDTTLFPFPISETTNNNGALNGSTGLVYNPNGKFQAYTNLSTGFRAPNIDDLGKVFDSEPGSVIVPNVDLKPEYAYNGEIGFVWMIAAKVKLDAAVYYTHLENALARANFQLDGQDSILYEGKLSRVQAVQNVADAQVYGFQGGVEWSIAKGFTFKSKISIQKGREYNVDSAAYFPKAHVAPTFGRTSLSYKTRQVRLDAYAVYHARFNNEDLPLNERDDLSYALDENGNAYTPQWYTLNFKVSYYFNKHLSATLGVENITNQLYRTAGSGISASGRNFIVALKATF